MAASAAVAGALALALGVEAVQHNWELAPALLEEMVVEQAAVLATAVPLLRVDTQARSEDSVVAQSQVRSDEPA